LFYRPFVCEWFVATLHTMNTIAYPAKILVAWAEAIGGNKDIREWLMANGYPELGLFVFALHNQEEARQWLLDKGHPHLMALINGAEGNPSALAWLKKFDFDFLEKMARAADNDDAALHWLLENGEQELATVAQRMRKVKNEIERNNNDMHRMSSD
jgi:hypothetical protein